jgi:hypothetical protein
MTMIGKPLNLEELFINWLAGSMDMFFFLAMIFFAFLAAFFRMPTSVYLILMGLFIILMAGLGYNTFYILLIFVGGLVGYYIISRFIKK